MGHSTRCAIALLLVACTHAGSSATAPDSGSVAAPDSGSGSATPDGGGGSDAGSSNALPLGSVTVTQATIACPKSAAPGATCMSLSVACPDIPDLAVTIAEVAPTGTPKGTIVSHDGGSGTGFYNGNTGDPSRGFAQSLSAKGYRYVQVAWADDWASTGKGIKTAGCRPATLFRWIFDNVHGGSRTTGFCAQSASGGTAAVLYSIAAYGLKDVWDYLQLAAGPTPARLDYGCDPSLYSGGARDLCPQLTDAPWQYESPGSSIVSIADGWEGTTTCDAASPPAGDVDKWASDSLISTGDDLDYPQTTMTYWYCVTTPNMSTGQASFFIDAAHAKNPAEVNCYTGTCASEEVFQDAGAFDLAVQEMTADCVPNH